MDEHKNNQIYYYILLSILLHSFIFFSTQKSRETALGKSYVPIEIIDITSNPDKKEYFLNPKKQSFSNQQKNKKKSRNKELQQEIIQKNRDIKDIYNLNKKSKDLDINKTFSNNNTSGSESDLNTNEKDRGSLKGKGIEKITCLSCLKPKYPRFALDRGYEGILKLEIIIAETGAVINVKLIKSSGYDILDKSGIYAARNSKFHPLTQQRKINIEYNLRLNR